METLPTTKKTGLLETSLMQNARIGRRTSILISVAFFIMLVIPQLHQLIHELKTTGRWRFLALFQESPTHASLKRFEDSLARDSELASSVRASYQAILTRYLRQGTEKIILGQDGYLFFRKEIDMIAGPGFLTRTANASRGINGDNDLKKKDQDPLSVIIDYKKQLADRGIHLIVAPIPAKPFIYPEKVWAGYPDSGGAAQNRDCGRFLEKLRHASIDVIDLAEDMYKAKSNGKALYLKQDTHWSPAGLDIAVQRLAKHIQSLTSGVTSLSLSSKQAEVSEYGDLVRMVESDPKGNLFGKESTVIKAVFEGDKPVKADDSAPVLVLGDSFCNIYSSPDLRWGEGAGLGEQLMNATGMHIQVIAQNGGGATAVRETLARRPQALKNKKVVLWAFSARDLYDESIAWESVPLPETKTQTVLK